MMQGADVEVVLRELTSSGDYEAATKLMIRSFGPEIVVFLLRRGRSDADAWDIFSSLCEDVWRGLPGFGWRCTARAWAFTLARHAEFRFRASAHRRPDRNVPLSGDLLEAMGAVRSSTAPYRRTGVKDRFRALRSRLAEEDQLILILRVDRNMSWQEIAHVLAAPGGELSEVEIQRQASRARKRFQLLKSRLREWAQAEGLLGPPPSQSSAAR